MTSGFTVDRLLCGYGTVSLTAMIALEIFMAGCGGSSKKTTPVDIQIVPPATSISVNSSVALQATGSSLVKYTTVVWEVQDEDLGCTTESASPEPPSISCPLGWIWAPITVGVLPQTAATYYSPNQPGTYHIIAVAQTLDGSSGQATSTITVTP